MCPYQSGMSGGRGIDQVSTGGQPYHSCFPQVCFEEESDGALHHFVNTGGETPNEAGLLEQNVHV